MTDDLENGFERGRRRGRDPVNTGRDGAAMTTADSLWLADFCEECGHTFRQGDRVMVQFGPPLTVQHHTAALPCSHAVEVVGEVADGARSRAFHDALDAANPPPDGMRAERLQPGHRLLVEVRPRLHCAFCSKTFRAYEMAVVCPCNPEEPKCGLGVHRDPGRGNDCFDAWIANGPLARCPTSLQKLP